MRPCSSSRSTTSRWHRAAACWSRSAPEARPTGWADHAVTFPTEGDSETIHGRQIDNTGKMPWVVQATKVTIEVRNSNLTSATLLDINGNAKTAGRPTKPGHDRGRTTQGRDVRRPQRPLSHGGWSPTLVKTTAPSWVGKPKVRVETNTGRLTSATGRATHRPVKAGDSSTGIVGIFGEGGRCSSM